MLFVSKCRRDILATVSAFVMKLTRPEGWEVGQFEIGKIGKYNEGTCKVLTVTTIYRWILLIKKSVRIHDKIDIAHEDEWRCTGWHFVFYLLTFLVIVTRTDFRLKKDNVYLDAMGVVSGKDIRNLNFWCVNYLSNCLSLQCYDLNKSKHKLISFLCTSHSTF